MATEFNTQTGGGKYRIQFETDNKEYFLLMQELARCCVDHPPIITNADRIRAMSDEELAAWMAECNAYKEYADASQWLPWLQEPAEVSK